MAHQFCGPHGMHLTTGSLEDGTLCRGLTAAPGPAGVHLLPSGLHLQTEFLRLSAEEILQRIEDQNEFQVLRQKVKVVNSKGVPFRDLNDYVTYRNKFFGSAWTYASFTKESDEELQNSKRPLKKGKVLTLRSRLDSHFQGSKMDEAVKYFYRWIRKSYKREFGEGTDVPTFIFRGRSEDLETALSGVEFGDARYGGFNPRPIKAKIKKDTYYKLGTLSDHASGLAIDIEPSTNPQISIKAWSFIEDFTHKSSTVDWREKQWLTAPGTLWKYVKDLSDKFAMDLAKQEKELAEKEKEAQKENSRTGIETKTDSERFKRSLLKEHFEELKKFTTGFFTLKQDLVETLREHGFT